MVAWKFAAKARGPPRNAVMAVLWRLGQVSRAESLNRDQDSIERRSDPTSCPDVAGGRWTVAVRTSGPMTEIAETRGDLLVVVITTAADEGVDPIRNRIRDLLEAAGQAPDPPGHRPIPLALQRVVRSLVE